MGRGIQKAEEMGAISKTSTQDEKTYEALRIATDSKAPSLKKINTKNKTKTKTNSKKTKPTVGSNPLHKSNTGLEIQRV